MADLVNLDALIPREDFEANSNIENSSTISDIQIRDLEKDAFFFNTIRKPDFQRETNEWDVNRVVDFIKSFLEGDLIPAIILWQGGGNLFIIDGAHRLSSLAAWVQDDFGDGMTSKLFFDGIIPNDQIKAAEKVRRAVKLQLGTYQDHKDAIIHIEKYPPDIVNRARRLASLAIQLQWVKGNVSKAEDSFFKINQKAAPIDKTEIRLLKSRKQPNAVAARAIIHSGTGHKYWFKFSGPIQNEIENRAKELNTLLFSPELKSPIKTLDLPIAGQLYGSETLPLVFDLVNIINDHSANNETIDEDGDLTITYLKNCQKVLSRISGTSPSCLGLHPIVYFYSDTGRYQPTSFFAVVELIKDMESHNGFRNFISIRRKYEDFMLRNKIFTNQVVYKYGSGLKGYLQLKDFYSEIINLLLEGKNEENILEYLVSDSKFSYLKPNEVINKQDGVNFNEETKSATFLRDALKAPLYCKICNGLIHTNSITIDHIVRKQDGGIGSLENAQLSHPYCNTTIKN